MISIPTVLVLGAGSSVHVGYPLGATLINNLCNLRGTQRLEQLPHWSKDKAEAFLTRLSRSGHYSIDAFLESNRNDGDLGKFLIALGMKQHENLDNLFPPHSSGWYQYLFNSLLADGKADFSRSKLGIITFNYDRSLEAYLHTVLQNRFRMDEQDATGILGQLPIVHVHGILGKYPETSYQTKCDTQELLEISQQIQIIHEIVDCEDGFCNDQFKQAHGMLEAAERIYFLGFGFHPDNVRRFQFFSPENTEGKLMIATTPNMGTLDRDRLTKRLSPLGFGSARYSTMLCDGIFQYDASLE